MVKIIITSGCSYTSGIELQDYKDNLDKGLEESKLIWSYKIKDILWPKADFFNASKSGASNSTIARKTIFYVTEFLKKYNPEDIIILTMWTGVDRREWRLPKNSKLTYAMSDFNYENTTVGDISLLKNLDKKGAFYNEHLFNSRKKYLKDKKLDKLIINYYNHLINKDSSLYNCLREIEYLSNFLDNNKIKYYYTTSDSDILRYVNEVRGNDMFLDRLIKTVNPNQNFFHQDNKGFTEFAKDYPFCKFGHPDKEAHLQYAKIMSMWIKSNQNV